LKGEKYFIDLKKEKIKMEKMFTHYKERVVKRGKIKCPPQSHV
jgi:hypothetical protein